jgi:hypothetical protein
MSTHKIILIFISILAIILIAVDLLFLSVMLNGPERHNTIGGLVTTFNVEKSAYPLQVTVGGDALQGGL